MDRSESSRRQFLRRTGTAATLGVAGLAGCLDSLTPPTTPEPATPAVAWRHTLDRDETTNVDAVDRTDSGVVVAESVSTGDDPRDWRGVLTVAGSSGVETLHTTDGRLGHVADDVVSTDRGFVYGGARLDEDGRPVDTWLTAVAPDGTERWQTRLAATAVWFCSPTENDDTVRLLAHSRNEASLRFGRVTSGDSHVEWLWTTEGPPVVSDVLAVTDRVLVGGRTANESGTPAVYELQEDGSRSRLRSYPDESVPYPSVVFAADAPARTLALNGTTATFTASFLLLGPRTGTGAETVTDWRLTATGWRVSAILEPPGWPELGRHRLVVAHRAGEQAADDTGAQVFTVDDAGGVRWRATPLRTGGDDRWRLQEAVSTDRGLLVAGEVPTAGADADLGVARLYPHEP
jgi:hypothetical protein